MPFEKGLHPGAVWMKCDFQVHTPRDPGWEGERFVGGDPEKEQRRTDWANTLIDACLSRGLSAVAITDHHDFAFVPYVQSAIAERGLSEKLLLFPGIEVTCDDSSQCLVLFDRDTDEELWNRMFGLLPHIQKAHGYLAVTAQAKLCGLQIRELVIALAESKVLSGKLIALPNASGEGGHKTILRKGYHVRFAELGTVGVYADHAYEEYTPRDLNVIHGRIREWGERRRGILPTGDNRSATFEKLGKNPCWIKLGEPTAEAIRQALLADEARVRYEQPIYAAQRLRGMTVSSSLTGKLRVTFNEGFNALIGGRGSGKSAMLEYIRFALGRSAVDIAMETGREREKQLLESTLADGYVSLDLDRNGVLETWQRSGSSSAILVSIAGAQEETISPDEAQKRFRARAFSQKQLSTLIRTAEDAAEQITGIAAVESLDRRRDLEQKIVEQKRLVQKCVVGLVEYWTAEALHETATKTVSDLNRRIATTKSQLEDEGLSEEESGVLDLAPSYDLADALLPETGAALQFDLQQVSKLSSNVLSLDKSRRNEVGQFTELEAFYKDADTTQATIKSHFDEIEKELRELIDKHKSTSESFADSSADFRKQHEKASSGQAKLAGLIAQLNRLTKELQEAESKQRQQKSRLDGLNNAANELEAGREKLRQAQEGLKAILEEAAGHVSATSSGVLRAKVLQEQTPRDYHSALLSLCEQANVKDSYIRCTQRVDEIMKDGYAASWEQIAQLSLALLKVGTKTASSPSTPPSEEAVKMLEAALFQLTEQQSARILAGLDAAKVGDILSASPRDFIEFEYRDGAKYIPFAQASQGQQAAALLDLLLRQEAGTLIIDQPEDDLDNKVIMDVVNLLHKSKLGRQLIFTTHNANFVVNGDADKVVALTPGTAGDEESACRIEIEADGAIDTPTVRQVITDTVEGGKEAFDLRGRKYQFL